MGGENREGGGGSTGGFVLDTMCWSFHIRFLCYSVLCPLAQENERGIIRIRRWVCFPWLHVLRIGRRVLGMGEGHRNIFLTVSKSLGSNSYSGPISNKVH